MPKIKITSRWVESVEPATEYPQVDYFDTKPPGFGLRVTRTGRKTWFCMYRQNGRLRRLTLGTYPTLTLADARDLAKQHLSAVVLGSDPAAEKKADRLAETFGELAILYLEKYAKVKKRSWKEDERIIEHDLLPKWKTTKAKNIRRRDVVALLDEIVARGAPIQANRVLALVRKIYNWAIGRDLLESNPCWQLKAPGKEKQRERVLSPDELGKVWNAFNDLDLLVGSIFKLRLLTAQRGDEIDSMRWEDLDLTDGWWTIPSHSAKNGLSHRVPLSGMALNILKNIKDQSGNEPWVFPSPTRKNQHIANIQKAVERIRKLTGVDFTARDLRRTAASHMTSIGIPRLVVSKILNHVESGVTRVYDRHSYDIEKRQALNKWTNHVVAIVSRNINNIVPLRQQSG